MSGDDRTVRVFVSSTFQDMAAERDELVRRVFPRVRRLCEERGVTFCEIDLRWGLTDQHVAEGAVLGICLEEIRRCQPYFIGLLGGRYGWVPTDIPDDLIAREPWLLPHRGESSITEMEILHGVLNDPAMEHRAFFYLRDGALDDAEEGPGRTARLRDLRDRVVASGHPTTTYLDPADLGAKVHADLLAMVDARFPVEAALGPEAAETRRHDRFAAGRAKGYVRRSSTFASLDALVDDATGPRVLWVRGESGAGKSALLAAWALDHRDRHPDHLVLTHFTGCSAESNEMLPLLRRLSHEMALWLGIAREPDGGALLGDEPTTDPIEVFRERLAAAGRHGTVVVVLDGADRLSPDDGAASLRWLPAPPNGVRFVVSALPGPVADELVRRGWDARQLEVTPLEPPERAEVTRHVLGAERGKHLTTVQVEQITRAPQTASPLYLRILLDELRIWGQHETLDSQLARLTAAPTVPDLLDLVLDRYETDLEADRPGLVGDAFRLLWASRQGLSESELLDLLGDGDRLPMAHWSTFRAAGSELLIDRAGLLGLAHPHVEAAVARRYITADEQEAAIRRRIADHFDGATSPRATAEVPHQLRRLGDWAGIVELLSDPDWFTAHRSHAPLDVVASWTAVHDATATAGDTPSATGMRAEQVYGRIDLDGWSTYALLELSSLLVGFGSHDLAARCIEIVVGRVAPADQEGLLARQRLAAVHVSAGDPDRAMVVLQDLERLCIEAASRAAGDDEATASATRLLATTIGSQGVINRARGELDTAMKQLGLLESVAATLGDRQALAFALRNQAQILASAGQLDGASERLVRSEESARTTGDLDELVRTVLMLADVAVHRGDGVAAAAHLDEAARLAGEAGDLAVLQVALRRRARLANEAGDADTALACWGGIASAARASGDGRLWSEALGRQAEVHASSGDLAAALVALGEADRAGRAFAPGTDPIPQLRNVTWALGMAATIHRRLGDDDTALRTYREQARMSEVLDDAETLQFALGSQATILQERGEHAAALELHRRVEQLCLEIGQAHGQALALAHQASITATAGDVEAAIRLLRRGIEVADGAGLNDLGDQMRSLRRRMEASIEDEG